MSMGTRGSARSAAVPKAADKNIIMVAASAWINVLFMIYPLCCYVVPDLFVFDKSLLFRLPAKTKTNADQTWFMRAQCPTVKL